MADYQFSKTDFRYEIYSPQTTKDPKHFAEIDRIFFFWQEFWNGVFKQNGTNEKINPDTFFRQKAIPVVKCGDEIVCVHLYDLFNLRLRSTLQHSYIASSFTSSYVEKLLASDVGLVMSMEYLSVNPNYRKSVVGFQFSEIMVRLGVHYMSQLNAEAAIAPARTDVGVAQLAYRVGFECVESGVQLHNTPCDLISFFQGKYIKSESLTINAFEKHLWANRIDYTDSMDSDRRKESEKMPELAS